MRTDLHKIVTSSAKYAGRTYCALSLSCQLKPLLYTEGRFAAEFAGWRRKRLNPACTVLRMVSPYA